MPQTNSGIVVVASRQEKDTKLMEMAASRIGVEDMAEFPRALLELLNQKTLSQVLKELGVSQGALGYWLHKLGIDVIRVAVPKNKYTIVLVPKGKKIQLVDE